MARLRVEQAIATASRSGRRVSSSSTISEAVLPHSALSEYITSRKRAGDLEHYQEPFRPAVCQGCAPCGKFQRSMLHAGDLCQPLKSRDLSGCPLQLMQVRYRCAVKKPLLKKSLAVISLCNAGRSAAARTCGPTWLWPSQIELQRCTQRHWTQSKAASFNAGLQTGHF